MSATEAPEGPIATADAADVVVGRKRPLLAQPAIARSGSVDNTVVSTFLTTRESSTIMI